MRRANEAMWHEIKIMTVTFLACPKGTRALACHVTEGAPERAEAVPTGLEGDVGDAEVSVTQQGLCPFDSPRKQVTVRWDSESLAERPREMRLRDAAYACQAADRPLLVRR